ncbi:MAG: nucleoside triphosphate pyrophosphohydrolase [Cellulosilyticaceae bacterium]
MYSYTELLDIIKVLRSEKGCAWDRKQTHESLMPHLLEESYELVDAIKKEDAPNMKEELGDILLQVLMHAEIASEKGEFTMEDIVDGIASKLVYRHPHVFEEDNKLSAEEVEANWEQLKKAEKKQSTQTEAMESIAKSLPALTRAQKIVKKAEEVGFLWDSYEPVVDKIKEELEEVLVEVKKQDNIKIEEEIGDLLFSVVNLAYILQINPEFALTNCMEKFINRFRYIENSTFQAGKQLSQLTLSEMDRLWEECKNVRPND